MANTSENYVQLNIVEVSRAELLLPACEVLQIIDGAKRTGFSLDVDGYKDVYMTIPWCAERDDTNDRVKLIFEFSGSCESFENWLDDVSTQFQIGCSHICIAVRPSVLQLKKNNPNPNKWFNKEWPVVKNFPANIASGYSQISDNRIGTVCLEVNCALASDDIGCLCSKILDEFPDIRLNEIAQGHEHAVSPDDDSPGARAEMTQATARLLFDVGAIEKSEYFALFSLIESLHSFIVPVARIFEKPMNVQAKNELWGI